MENLKRKKSYVYIYFILNNNALMVKPNQRSLEFTAVFDDCHPLTHIQRAPDSDISSGG